MTHKHYTTTLKKNKKNNVRFCLLTYFYQTTKKTLCFKDRNIRNIKTFDNKC